MTSSFDLKAHWLSSPKLPQDLVSWWQDLKEQQGPDVVGALVSAISRSRSTTDLHRVNATIAALDAFGVTCYGANPEGPMWPGEKAAVTAILGWSLRDHPVHIPAAQAAIRHQLDTTSVASDEGLVEFGFVSPGLMDAVSDAFEQNTLTAAQSDRWLFQSVSALRARRGEEVHDSAKRLLSASQPHHQASVALHRGLRDQIFLFSREQTARSDTQQIREWEMSHLSRLAPEMLRHCARHLIDEIEGLISVSSEPTPELTPGFHNLHDRLLDLASFEVWVSDDQLPRLLQLAPRVSEMPWSFVPASLEQGWTQLLMRAKAHTEQLALTSACQDGNPDARAVAPGFRM